MELLSELTFVAAVFCVVLTGPTTVSAFFVALALSINFAGAIRSDAPQPGEPDPIEQVLEK